MNPILSSWINESLSSVFLQLMFGVTAFLIVSAIAVLLLSKSSSAVKHRIWSLGLVGVLTFPVIAPVFPQWGRSFWSRIATTAVVDDADIHPSIFAPPADATSTSTAERIQFGQISVSPQQPTRPQASPIQFKQPDAQIAGVSNGHPEASDALTREAANDAASSESTDAKTEMPRIWGSLWRGFSWLSLAGTAVGLVVWILGHVTAKRVVGRAATVNDSAVLAARDELLAKLGLKRNVIIKCSPETSIPQATGIFTAAVLLPPGYGRWHVEQLRTALAHELAHVARRDVMWQSLAQLACCLYWVHPMVWAAAWRMRVEREHACDDAVLRIGASPTRYATHLVDLAASLCSKSPPLRSAVAMASRSSVEARVRSILRSDISRAPVNRRLGVCLAALMIATVAAAGVLRPLGPAVTEPQSATGGVVSMDPMVTLELSSELEQPIDEKDGSNDFGPPELIAMESSTGGASENDADHSAASTEEAPIVPMTTLRGMVVDEHDQPVPGMRVDAPYILGTAHAVTNDEGEFQIAVPTRVAPGCCLVTKGRDHQRMGFVQLEYDPWQIDSTVRKIQIGPTRRLDVEVVDIDQRPVEGAKVVASVAQMLHFEETSAEDGRVTFWLPANGQLHEVLAIKPRLGLDYRAFFDPQRLRLGIPQKETDTSQPVVLTLAEPMSIEVTVVDAQRGTPVSNVQVYPWLLKKPSEPGDLNVSMFLRQLSQPTDARGVAVFDWIPKWNTQTSMTFWTHTEDYAHERESYDVTSNSGKLTMRLNKLVPIRGRVRDPDGNPVVGLKIVAAGVSYATDDFRGETLTNENGEYEIRVTPNRLYMVIVDDEEWSAPVQDGFIVKPEEPQEGINFALRPTTRIFGQVTFGTSSEPIPGQLITSSQDGTPLNDLSGLTLPNPDDSRRWIQPHYYRYTKTDEDGRYEFFVGPGKFDIRGPTQLPVRKFEIHDETSQEFNFQTPRAETGRLIGSVVFGADQQPVRYANIGGIYRSDRAGRDIEITTDENGRFDIKRESHGVVMHVQNHDQSLAAIHEIGPDTRETTILLAPTAIATARLIDGETGESLAGREIQYGVDVYMGENGKAAFRTSFGGTAVTDENGAFQLDRLAVGGKYNVAVVVERDANGDPRGWQRIGEFSPEAGSPLIELGDLELKPEYQPPTLTQRIRSAFHKGLPAAERYQDSLRDIRLGHLRMLLMFADPEADSTEQFFKLRYEDPDVRSALDNYWVTPLPITGDSAEDTHSLAAELGVDLSQPESAVVVLIDEDEQQLVRMELTDLANEDGVDKQLVLDFLNKHAPAPLDSQELLDAALAQAKAENKRVFISEGATWCGPCWSLTRFMHERKQIFEKDYITLKLDHRWTHTDEIMQRLRDGQRGGIPWSVILDAEGNTLATSTGPDGNCGFPSTESGIEHFMNMLATTRIRLSDEDLASIRNDLEK